MTFEPLYTAGEMREAEAGHDVDEMMRRAGEGVAAVVLERFPDAQVIAVRAGTGANGGDGRIAGDVLRSHGWTVSVNEPFGDVDLVVDALLGTGFRGEPRPEAAQEIEEINASGSPVVSVDIPSGVDASTGEVPGPAVRAELTVTMHGWKVGLAVAPGLFHAGEVVVAEIGVPQRETAARLVTRDVLGVVPRRTRADNKYSAGSVLVVGGSRGLSGAAALCARAAFRADAGYVAVAAPAESLPVLETLVVEAVKRPVEEIEDALGRASALAIGPGLGRGRPELVRRLLETDLPAVVDADALFELDPFERDAPTVLTPHAGELARLLGRESSWVAAHRLAALAEAVDRFHCVVLLKGADTLVGAPGEGVLACVHDVPALATAGTGDVLTGVVAAMLAKGMDARVAAAVAATAHAAAAELGPERGLVASDVVDALPDAFDAV